MPKTRESSSPKMRASQTAKDHQPTKEAIAQRAYQIYLERGGTPGHAFEDWIRAEHELSEKPARARRKAAAA